MLAASTSYFEYRAALSLNRETFLVNHEHVVRHFVACDRDFDVIMELLREYDQYGKTQVSLAAFVMVMRRQAQVAFNHVSEYQAHQGWVMFRFVVELALFIGMFIDDRRNFELWMNKHNDLKGYMKAFQGKQFCPKALKNSTRIRSVHKFMNDHYLHVNPSYFYRHLSLKEGDTESRFNLTLAYSEEQYDTYVSSIAMVHLLALIQDSMWATIGEVYYPNRCARELSLRSVRREYSALVEKAAAERDDYREVLTRLGAWEVR